MKARSEIPPGLLARLRQSGVTPVLALLLGVFLLLALAARTPGLLRLDEGVTRWVQRPHGGWQDRVALGFTLLGNAGPLLVLAVAAALGLFLAGRPRAALFSVLTFLGVPLNLLIKQVIHRPRPTVNLVQVLLHPGGLSFPSGHAMGSTMFYGFLAVMAWTHLRPRGPRFFCTAALSALPVCIGLSRVYLGVHWMSDVVGGWTAGLFFLVIMAEIYRGTAAGEVRVWNNGA
jgi:undecaprenyl-diphosphatase